MNANLRFHPAIPHSRSSAFIRDSSFVIRVHSCNSWFSSLTAEDAEIGETNGFLEQETTEETENQAG
jgi:hypothetical protein